MTKADRFVIRAFLITDQAAESGVAIARYHERENRLSDLSFDVVSSAADIDASVLKATQMAGGRVRDVFWVYEDHGDFYFARGNTSIDTVLGMGAARGRWEHALSRLGHPKEMRDKVTSKDWRRAVLGLRSNTPGPEAKERAVNFVELKYRQTINHNAAEAVCMLQWAATVIPSRMGAARLQRDLFPGVR